mmetsp:Transcript_26697/g.85638  ORF Transcript_26697/g.85638 Transcript_26697/m.85638 type:complete len:111 (-) Transcript_26697:116-448(-)|eukprot:CAMPEP_0185297218 /NCGR_PEP_ID=MMETSP1363-20130426/9691_1 /TAXON_ID=38817 /ORGANISM="Gephyrocapsa oceanica, Strain RCC1303" /LENGTH=110 /DNA_ID=CAMNT_0027893955 /DNA_START=55 /DNA_END=387 /DNA_ORIENTATION=+
MTRDHPGPLQVRVGIRLASLRAFEQAAQQLALCASGLAAAPWTPSSHAAYPPRFREAVRTLLLCAAREGASPAVLPTEALLLVVEQLAWRWFWDVDLLLERADSHERLST